jgi:hypothetical protein
LIFVSTLQSKHIGERKWLHERELELILGISLWRLSYCERCNRNCKKAKTSETRRKARSETNNGGGGEGRSTGGGTTMGVFETKASCCTPVGYG